MLWGVRRWLDRIMRRGVLVKTLAVDDALFHTGLYSSAEASRIISQALRAFGKKGVAPNSLRRWSEGYAVLDHEYKAIIGTRYRIEGVDVFTFPQLIELLTIAFLRQAKLPFKKISYAYERGRELWGDHPFATKQYSIKGVAIFQTAETYGGEMEDLSSGQLAMEEILKPFLHHIQNIVIYRKGVSQALTPLGPEKSVILDPEMCYGAPVNKSTGIQTATLFGMYKAEGSNKDALDTVAHWYRVSAVEVEEAVEYETALLAA